MAPLTPCEERNAHRIAHSLANNLAELPKEMIQPAALFAGTATFVVYVLDLLAQGDPELRREGVDALHRLLTRSLSH